MKYGRKYVKNYIGSLYQPYKNYNIMNIYMEKHLLHPNHPKFEPEKWNKKYIQYSHNCYTYAMNTISKKNVKTCKRFSKMNKKGKTRKIRKIKKKTRKIFDTWDWMNPIKTYKKKDICPYIRPQIGVYSKSYKSSLKDISKKKIEKLLLKDNPSIKKVKRGEKISYGYYKIFLYLWKNEKKGIGDLHFLRQDNTGEWSHKDAILPVKKLKEKTPEDHIKNIKRRNRKKKSSSKIYVCGYYAVPIKGKKNLGSLYFL